MPRDERESYVVVVLETTDISPRRRSNLPNLFVKIVKSVDGDLIDRIRRRRTRLGKSLVSIREDLQPNLEFQSKEEAISARDEMASRLSKLGYTVNPNATAAYSIYVLELTSKNSKKRRFYVGQTSKIVDDRIKEHQSGIRASRSVKNDFVRRVIEFEPSRKFASKWDAESEETELGLKLIEQGFDVVGPQGLPKP